MEGLFRQRKYPFICSMIQFIFFGPFCKGPLKQAAEIMLVNIIKSAYLCRKHLPVPIDQ